MGSNSASRSQTINMKKSLLFAALTFASNGDGTFTVAKESPVGKYAVYETIKTGVGARTIAYDPSTNHVFTITADYGPIPAATTENPRPHAPVLPRTFMLMEFGKKGSNLNNIFQSANDFYSF
jgi:hypothetical protein